MKKKILISSVLTIALCLSLIAGSTYALFTSNTTTNVAVTAGKVNVVASINPTLSSRSLGDVESYNRGGSFANGGKATLDQSGKLIINNMTPGDVVQFTIEVENNSDISIQYRVKGVSTGTPASSVDLSEALIATATINGAEYTLAKTAQKEFTSGWIPSYLVNDAAGEISEITVQISFPNDSPQNDNVFQGATASLAFTVEAVQGNGANYIR